MPRKTRTVVTVHYRVTTASMRPRPDAAENAPRRSARRPPRSGFNEAAARCRGKLAGAGEERA